MCLGLVLGLDEHLRHGPGPLQGASHPLAELVGPASLNVTALAAITCGSGQPCSPGYTAASTRSASSRRHRMAPPRAPRESCGPSSCRRLLTNRVRMQLGGDQPAKCAMSTTRAAPTSSAISRNRAKSSAGCSTTNRQTEPSGGDGWRASRPRPCPRAGCRAARGTRTPRSCARRRSRQRIESGVLRARSQSRARRRLARTGREAQRRWRSRRIGWTLA